MRAQRVPRTRPRPLVQRRSRILTRSASIIAGTVLLTSVGASPALAELHDVTTASVTWQYVDDATGTISDAAAHDTPANLTGWTSDAFDEFGQLRLTEPGSGQFWDFVAARSERTVIDGETAEWLLTGSPGWIGFDYDVTLTLTMRGNSARWAYGITGGPVMPAPAEPVATGAEPAVEATPADAADPTVSFGGELGSDAATRYVVNGTTLMSDDGGRGDASAEDPVLGYAVTTDGVFTGWSAVAGSDTPRAGATGVTTFSVDLVYADYNSCGFTAARSLVTSLLPTLPALFGAVYPATGECIAFDPVTLELGVAADQILVFQVDPRLTLDEFFQDPIDVVVEDLPAGLESAAQQDPTDGSILIHVTGTPTELGDYTASTVFSVPRSLGTERAAVALPAATPIYSTIAFRIVPAAAVIVPPTATPTPKPVATPPDSATPTPTPLSTPPDDTPPTTVIPAVAPPVTPPVAPPVIPQPPTAGPPSTPIVPTVTPSGTPQAPDVTPQAPKAGPSPVMPFVTPAVPPAVTVVTALPTAAVPASAAQASATRTLPMAGIDTGRSLGYGLLAILLGTLSLTGLALRSYARSARNNRR